MLLTTISKNEFKDVFIHNIHYSYLKFKQVYNDKKTSYMLGENEFLGLNKKSLKKII